MKKILSLAAIVLFLAVLANACKKDKADNDDDDNNNPPPTTVDCATVNSSFSASVAPLIASSCAKSGCHASGSTNGPGALTTYTQIFNARARIRTSVANGSMPQDATFTAAQKAIITCWVDAGGQQN